MGKPISQSYSVTLSIGEHFEKALGSIKGFEGLLAHTVADHATCSKVIETSPINHIIFTGSVSAGHKIYKSTSKQFIDCNLELGGKDGAYVAPDADIRPSAECLVDGAMYNAGQSCCGIERVYVHESIYNDFLDRCKELIKEYVLGDPMDQKTSMGPMAAPRDVDKIQRQTSEAVNKGAVVELGGKIKIIGKGIFFEPTLITNATHEMMLMKEEHFGPIMPVKAISVNT